MFQAKVPAAEHLPAARGSSSPTGLLVLESGLEGSPSLGEAVLVSKTEARNGNMPGLGANWSQHTLIPPRASGQGKSYNQGQGQGAQGQSAAPGHWCEVLQKVTSQRV